jgi:methionyl-tRNA formyltransferase
VRIVLISQVPQAVHGLTPFLSGAGHDVVALLCSREHAGRYGNAFDVLVRDAPGDLDIVIPARREGIAPLLRRYEPDAFICLGFPWKIPPDALNVPRLGAINGHPSLLPHYRGPSPVSWAIRNAETEIGYTWHRMDPGFDTGPILAQGTIALEDEHTWEELEPKLVPVVVELLTEALGRVEAGDPGDPQEPGAGDYFPFFGDDYAWIDPSRTRDEVYRQVKAWRFASAGPGLRGALADLDGESVRVLRTSLEPADGGALECGDGTLWIVETEAA